MPCSWCILIWESQFRLSLFLYGQESHLYQTWSWLCRCLFKSPLFLKLRSQPLCWHMKLGSAWWVILCCSNLPLNGKLWLQSSQTKRRSLWVYICLSNAVWVANFLSHRSQSTTPWSTGWWLLSSLIEPKTLCRFYTVWYEYVCHGFLIQKSSFQLFPQVDTPAISTFSLIFSPDDTMGFLPPYWASTGFVTKLLTLLISALAWASSLHIVNKFTMWVDIYLQLIPLSLLWGNLFHYHFCEAIYSRWLVVWRSCMN